MKRIDVSHLIFPCYQSALTMPAMRITRRIVDPITFVERVGVEFIPRLEDSVLDDQLAGSMSYLAPKELSIPPPPPPAPFSPDEYRPPTPPKQRGKSGQNPNSPRSSIQGPVDNQRVARRSSPGGLLASPGGTLFSPSGRAKRKSIQPSLVQIGEDEQLSEGSLTDMSALQTSLSKLEETVENKKDIVKSVRFADEVQMNEISRLRNSMLEDMFWGSEDIANFRYAAFMEEAGLDMAEFD